MEGINGTITCWLMHELSTYLVGRLKYQVLSNQLKANEQLTTGQGQIININIVII